jgi:hypothetical protein
MLLFHVCVAIALLRYTQVASATIRDAMTRAREHQFFIGVLGYGGLVACLLLFLFAYITVTREAFST